MPNSTEHHCETTHSPEPDLGLASFAVQALIPITERRQGIDVPAVEDHGASAEYEQNGLADLSPNLAHRGPQPEDLIKVGMWVVLPVSIAIGGATGFLPVFDAFMVVICAGALVAAMIVPAWLIWKSYQQRQDSKAAALQLS